MEAASPFNMSYCLNMDPLFGKQIKSNKLTQQKLQTERRQIELEIQELQDKLEQANKTDQGSSICFVNNLLVEKSHERLERITNLRDNLFKTLLEQKAIIGNKRFFIKRKQTDEYVIWKEARYETEAEQKLLETITENIDKDPNEMLEKVKRRIEKASGASKVRICVEGMRIATWCDQYNLMTRQAEKTQDNYAKALEDKQKQLLALNVD